MAPWRLSLFQPSNAGKQDPETAKSLFPLVCLLLSIRNTFLRSQHTLYLTVEGKGAGKISCLVGKKKHVSQNWSFTPKHRQAFLGETGLSCMIIDNILAVHPFPTFTKGWSNFSFGNENQRERECWQNLGFRFDFRWFSNVSSVRVSSEVYCS